MQRVTERWPSGRRRSPAKGVYPEGYRGFESHLLRHMTFIDFIDFFEASVWVCTHSHTGGFRMYPTRHSNGYRFQRPILST